MAVSNLCKYSQTSKKIEVSVPIFVSGCNVILFYTVTALMLYVGVEKGLRVWGHFTWNGQLTPEQRLS